MSQGWSLPVEPGAGTQMVNTDFPFTGVRQVRRNPKAQAEVNSSSFSFPGEFQKETEKRKPLLGRGASNPPFHRGSGLGRQTMASCSQGQRQECGTAPRNPVRGAADSAQGRHPGNGPSACPPPGSCLRERARPSSLVPERGREDNGSGRDCHHGASRQDAVEAHAAAAGARCTPPPLLLQNTPRAELQNP